MAAYSELFEGIVYEPTQAEGRGFDLTVADVYELTESGRVDFGGGELEPAEIEPHESAKRNPDDDYRGNRRGPDFSRGVNPSLENLTTESPHRLSYVTTHFLQPVSFPARVILSTSTRTCPSTLAFFRIARRHPPRCGHCSSYNNRKNQDICICGFKK
jgi:hypothetical protein